MRKSRAIAEHETWVTCTSSDTVMEEFLKRELATSKLRCLGRSSGGCISDGQSYETDSGRVFVKYNTEAKTSLSHEEQDLAKLMFDGEYASLCAIYNTQTVSVPRPIKVVEHPTGKGWVFIMEHVEMRPLSRFQAALGEQLARLHLYNASLKQKYHSSSVGSGRQAGGYVDKFGFECDTCCGFIPMPNEWQNNWVEFFTRQRLQPQLDLIENKYGDRELRELWPQLQRRVSSFFAGLEIEPALLHGDLWSGNAAENEEGPVIFDPASFYGHHEFDLAIAGMFGGFSGKFYDAYHQLIPKAPGFATRHKLYVLFHYMNHWNHFGTGYRSQTVSLMRELISL